MRLRTIRIPVPLAPERRFVSDSDPVTAPTFSIAEMEVPDAPVSVPQKVLFTKYQADAKAEQDLSQELDNDLYMMTTGRNCIAEIRKLAADEESAKKEDA